MIWSDAQIERVKSLADAGMSAAQIANELGDGISRNAVVGIGHRRGFHFHGTSGSASGWRSPKPREPKISITLIESSPPRAGMLTLEELGSGDCKWPMGDPLTP